MANYLFIFWIIVNVLLFVHVFHEFILMLYSLKSRKKNKSSLNSEELPFITVQLPLYNEKYVVERLLEAVSQLEYPKDKFEVQILDDSNDETTQIIEKFIQKASKNGISYEHIRREDRTGYKAGALAYGMSECKGEFIAIFDADFVPDPEFLIKTIPHFDKPNIGLVQTRWEHLNEDYSMLTRAQAIMLNTHFGIEQLGRKNANGFINFNGTAGIWRKECIESAGGWHADTLTEDLDLSFRAQSEGWEFEYLFNLGSPAELPITFEAYRTQQFRWSKGAAECLRKNSRKLWQSKASFKSKTIGSFHLLNSSVYLLVVAILLLSPVVFYYNKQELINIPYQDLFTLFGTSVIYLLLIIFFIGSVRTSKNTTRSILLFLPSIFLYFAMTTGISLYMIFGVLEGYRGKSSAFIRTPKFGSSESVLHFVQQGYDYKKEYSIMLLELVCLVYGAFWVSVSITDLNIMSLLYGLIILTGFSLSLFFKKSTFRWS